MKELAEPQTTSQPRPSPLMATTGGPWWVSAGGNDGMRTLCAQAQHLMLLLVSPGALDITPYKPPDLPGGGLLHLLGGRCGVELK